MDVSVTDLRAQLSLWLKRAAGGDEIVVTDRGMPVARIVGAGAKTTLERLIEDGVIGMPERSVRRTASPADRITARRSIADIVSQQRD